MNNEDLPLHKIHHDGGMMNIFRTIGCIGDSLSSGEFEYIKADGSMGYWDNYPYSWGKCIERLTAIQMTNFSRGGLTAYQLYTEADQQNSPNADINNLFVPAHAKQGYIIALGVNDLKCPGALDQIYHNQIGNVSNDICLEDYTQNAESFAGYYTKIILRLKTIQPDAKFFLMSMPKEEKRDNEILCELLYEMANKLSNCYVIDLFHYAPVYDESFRQKYFCGHMTAMGYQLTAYYIMTYIDWIINHHIDDFKFIPFIGSPYTPRKS